jgi:hypothetical protein
VKNLKQMLVVTLVFCAVNARASYSVDGTPGPLSTVNPGDSGQSTLQLVLGSGYTYTLKSTSLFRVVEDSSNLPAAPFSPISVQEYNVLSPTTPLNWVYGSTIAAGTYDLIVSWTALPNSSFIGGGGSLDYGLYDIAFKVTVKSGTKPTQTYSGGPQVDIEPALVAEPTQAVASCMLLGCGALGFAGRRLLKKRAK